MTLKTPCLSLVLLLGAGAAQPVPVPSSEWERQVRETEQAFARTMAERDHAAFVSFLAEDAVFLSASGALRGRLAVAEGWRARFEGPRAPFSWEPERVAALESGALALSTGPVRDPDGRRAGTFTSTWRREPDGKWRIVLDSGCPPCECTGAATH